jgi:hypothetical protein
VKTEADVKLAKAIDAAIEEHLRNGGADFNEAHAGVAATLMHKFAQINFVIGVPSDVTIALAGVAIELFYEEHGGKPSQFSEQLKNLMKSLEEVMPSGPTH